MRQKPERGEKGSDLLVMATLIRKPGDPSYLKVVLLREILIGDEAEQLNLTVEEGRDRRLSSITVIWKTCCSNFLA